MNNHTNLFFESFYKCPIEYRRIIRGFYIDGFCRQSFQFSEDNRFKDCVFNGLIFKGGKVLVFNIVIFNKDENYKSEYMDITKVFNLFLEKYDIILLSLMINKVLYSYFRENIIAENLIYSLQNCDESSRFFLIKRQRNREKPFIRDNSSENEEDWFTRIKLRLDKKENLELLKTKTPFITALKLINNNASKNSIL